ncbi:helix-turn-helix transcriptional regulator [Hymenobacter sp. H14-R3]|uniref:helix-turn-helix domain-containing protein n=1 Tax=Hymenobacter sp. H14-R3 TaxID=3046308 RepID=UPI0024BBA4C9|nr:helix-turn-helix transcriptional regulator [Hymenobacter sp. H14-R3]MDJ0367227.1 helix-turn-helix transcriptional regulator [Hymenobacter sp. H14-R3]
MPAPDSIGQRFTQLIQHLGLSKNAFAQSLDKTATVIQHLVDERNKPGYDLLCKVFDTYPNVSKDWLMLGQGPMLLEPTAPTASAPAAPLAAPAEAFEPPLPPPLRRRATDDGALLQPADIAATVALAAANLPKPATVPGMAAAAPSIPAAAPSILATPTGSLPLPAAPFAAPSPDPAYLTVALQTQYLQHQLALAEQRNQHLVAQQALMQQMVALLQRTS